MTLLLMEFEVKISEKIPAYLILTPLPHFSGGACFSIKKKNNLTLLVYIVGFTVELNYNSICFNFTFMGD